MLLKTVIPLVCIAAFGLGIFTGCVNKIPVDDYTMARAAYEAAKAADAARFAPNIWFSAEESYRAGEKSFKDRRYDDAILFFHRAQELSEQAENIAQITSKQSGEVIP